MLNNKVVVCPADDYYGNARPIPTLTHPDIGAVESDQGTKVGLFPEERIFPETVQLLQNYPNPFNPTTTIEYKLSQPGRVTLSIFNLSGQHIRTLVDEEKNVGAFSVMWDATDKTGQKMGSGVYLYRIQIFDVKKVREAWRAEHKMLLLK